MHLVDEDDHVLGALDFVHHSLDPLLELAAVFGTSNHQGKIEGDDLLIQEDFGHDTAGDFLRQTLGDGGLADAGLTNKHRIVFGAAAKDLDDAADLVFTTDHRVEFALTSQLGEVATKGFEGGRFNVLFATFFASRTTLGSSSRGLFAWTTTTGTGLAFVTGKLRIELAQDFVTRALDVDVKGLEYTCRHAFTLAQQAEQDVLGAHIGVVKRLGFLAGEGEDFLHPRRVRDASLGFGFLADANLLFNGITHRFQVEAHLLQHADSHTLTQLDQTQQEVLGAHVIMVKAVGFFARQCEDLLRAGGEVIHGFHREWGLWVNSVR